MDQRLVWAAGFFDGEGCVMITRHKRPVPKCFASGRQLHAVGLGIGYTLRVQVTNRNVTVLEPFRVLFGGHLGSKATNAAKQGAAFYWELNGRAAQAALERLLPYLVGKRPVAEVGIAFCQYQQATFPGRARPRLAEQNQQLFAYWQEVRRLISLYNNHPFVEQPYIIPAEGTGVVIDLATGSRSA